MSGLNEQGELYGFVQGGAQVAQRDIDQYQQIQVDNPAVDVKYIGTAAGGTNAQAKPLVLINQFPDHPRNLIYSVVGTNDVGGTWTVNGFDQFGKAVTETAGFGTKANGTPAGSVFGTIIWGAVMSGTWTFAVGSAGNGSAQVGFGTVENGSAQSNWFGLLSKIAGTGDVQMLTWINNGTPTGLAAGTAFGTLISASQHAFQGTSGVALTDRYRALTKPTFDNAGQGTMCNL